VFSRVWMFRKIITWMLKCEKFFYSFRNAKEIFLFFGIFVHLCIVDVMKCFFLKMRILRERERRRRGEGGRGRKNDKLYIFTFLSLFSPPPSSLSSSLRIFLGLQFFPSSFSGFSNIKCI